MSPGTVKRKIISDPIHGQISFHPLCMKIIDTPQFQRLRRINQLGFVYTVFPSAVHDRFSHSLGVSYLAGKFVRELHNNQPYLKIDDSDVLCIEIAGLCHDLGHGPFSHTWEHFMKQAAKQKGEQSNWKHEDASVHMLDYLIDDNGLSEAFFHFGVDPEHVKNLIKGKRIQGKQAFLSQIVNNEDSGLDVDKWDYYLRDCYHLGILCGFDYERLIRFARVIKVNGLEQICFRDKVKSAVYSMFRTRSELHHQAYQHRVAAIVHQIVYDALLEFDQSEEWKLLVTGKKRNLWEITRSTTENKNEKDRMKAMKDFCELTDDYVYHILRNKPGDDIMDCIARRSHHQKFYRFIAQWSIKKLEDEDLIRDGIVHQLMTAANDLKVTDKKILPSRSDIVVQVIPIHWGKGAENPVNFVTFYSKNMQIIESNEDEESVNWMLPRIFQDIQVRVLCRNSQHETCRIVEKCCEFYRKSVKT